MTADDTPRHDDAWIRTATANAAGMIRRYPAGTIVRHRATGERGVVSGWTITGDGATLIQASDGTGTSLNYDFEIATAEDDADNEGWKHVGS